jgi:hypothetical protein
MHIMEIYPRFTLTDFYNRALRYERRGDKYYRKWLNPPVEMARKYLEKEISRSQYAYGLLAKIEYEINGLTLYAPDVRQDVTDEEPSELDKWFGPKRGV